LVKVAAVRSLDSGPFGSMFDRCEHRARRQCGDSGYSDNSKKLHHDDFLISEVIKMRRTLRQDDFEHGKAVCAARRIDKGQYPLSEPPNWKSGFALLLCSYPRAT
jgi:hypothetical protein